MAKKPTSESKSAPKTPSKAIAPKPTVAAKSTPAPVSSPVRATPLPKVPAPKPVITHDAIAKRAYEIFASGTGGSEHENWTRAERELRGA